MPEGLEHQAECQALLCTARVGADKIPFLPGQSVAGIAFVVAETIPQAQEASRIADDRNGFIEAEVIAQDDSERYW